VGLGVGVFVGVGVGVAVAAVIGVAVGDEAGGSACVAVGDGSGAHPRTRAAITDRDKKRRTDDRVTVTPPSPDLTALAMIVSGLSAIAEQSGTLTLSYHTVV
jgi:hypothetical protein